jgi:hypothetical protein
MARYNGTSGHDTFILGMSQLSGSTVTGGAGSDTIKISNTGAFTFSTASYRTLSGIDVLDFSAHTSGRLDVRLSASMLQQSDAGQITIVSGAGGIDALRASSSLGGTVLVAGSGDVYLDTATSNCRPTLRR